MVQEQMEKGNFNQKLKQKESIIIDFIIIIHYLDKIQKEKQEQEEKFRKQKEEEERKRLKEEKKRQKEKGLYFFFFFFLFFFKKFIFRTRTTNFCIQFCQKS